MKDIAICVRHWDWSETSQTVSLFCREHGLVRAVVKGARREGSPFSGGLEIATRGEALMIIKGGDAMATLTAWGLIDTYPAIRRSLAAFHAAMYMIDVVQRAVREHDPHPRLFDVLAEGLSAIDVAPSIGKALVWLQWAALADTGIAPALDRDVTTGEVIDLASSGPIAVDPARGGVVVHSGKPDQWRVRPETVSFLRCVSEAWIVGSHEAWFSDEAIPGDVVGRAGRLLASLWSVALGLWPPSVTGAYSDLDVPNLGKSSEGRGFPGR